MLIAMIIIWSIAIFGIVIQFINDHISKKKKNKKRFGFIIMICTIIPLIVTGVIQQIEGNKLADEFNNSNEQIDSLYNVMGEVRYQNDSLLFLNKMMQLSLNQTNKGIQHLSESTSKGFLQNQRSIENISVKSSKRIITSEQKDLMINILSEDMGAIEIYSTFGDPETFQYASQFKEVFEKSGWDVQGVMRSTPGPVLRGPSALNGVFIIKIDMVDKQNKNEQLGPGRLKELFLAFNKAEVDLQWALGENFEFDELHLVVYPQ